MTGTFDLTFDYTFGGLVITNYPTEEPPCGERRRGAYLYWLSTHGFGQWLFSGKENRGLEVSNLGSFVKDWLPVSTQKISQKLATLRTEGLTDTETEYVRGVLSAIKVWVLAPDVDNVFHAVEISVDTGSFAIGGDDSSRTYLSFQIRFAAMPSQRA
jgi:hypothetical protein